MVLKDRAEASAGCCWGRQLEKRKGRRRPGLRSRVPGVHGPGGPPLAPILPHVLCPSQLKDSLTLHLSSGDNITGRDAGHVDQVDRTVSLNMETRWKDSINPINLTSTNIRPRHHLGQIKPWARPLPLLAQPHPWVLLV